MKSAVETLNPTRVKLTIEVPLEELKPSLDAAFTAIGRQVSIPGFRPGKVPTRLIEQRVGRAAVLEEAVNHALPDLYSKAAQEHNVRPLGAPEVEIDQLPMSEDEQLRFTVEVDVRPELTLPELSELTVTVDAITDGAIQDAADERMTSLRERFKSLIPVERAVETGDYVVIDLSAQINGVDIDTVKGVSYEVGSGTMLNGLDDALVGMAAEETKDFVAPLAGGEHEGTDADVTVTVTAVKVAELPELDDDFASMASEFDTLAELEADVREQASQAKRFEQGVQARDRLLELLKEKVEVPVPEGVVEDEVHAHLEQEGRLEDEEHRAEVETSTREGLATQLLLDALVERSDVTITREELLEYLMATSQQYGLDPNEFARMLEERQQLPAMVADVTRRKALATALEQVKVVDEAGAAVDLSSVLGSDDDEGDSSGEPGAMATGEAKPAEDQASTPAPADGEDAPAEKPAAKKATKAAAKKTADKSAEKPAKKTESSPDEAKPAAKKTAKKATKAAAKPAADESDPAPQG